jgi:copper chaperone NosL
MTIADARFAAELITAKGRIYKFDDYSCMQNYLSEAAGSAKSRTFIANYLNPGQLLSTTEAVLVSGEKVNSPMGGNVAAFGSKEEADIYARKLDAEIIPGS